jgi:hypothetical protein
VILTLAPATAARATVVPQQGMKGLRLGMTPAQVRATLGSPDWFAFVRDRIIGRTRVWRYGLTRVSFDGATSRARVLTLDTTSPHERLANGIGVGSTRAAVDRRVRGTRCVREFRLDHCFIGRFAAGRTVTDFVISRRGRVKRIVVGRVVD